MSKKILTKIGNLLTLALAIAFIGILSPVGTSAAANGEPYGFTFDDAANSITVYRYYCLGDKSEYVPYREFYSRGSYLYTNRGILLKNGVLPGAPYNGFDSNGIFYSIGVNGSMIKYDFGNTPTVILKDGALKLNYDSADLAVSVTTAEGTLSLATLKKVAESDTGFVAPTKTVSPNRVDMYENSAGEFVYEAYQSGKLKYKVLVSKNGKKVLNRTAGVRLTDTLTGAKFIGFDTSYNVYLFEGSTLYRFIEGKWFSAQKLVLSGNFKTFERDSNGFITKIVTQKSSYQMKQLAVSGGWKASRTYVVKKANYKTLYKKGSVASNTLTHRKGNLYLDGAKIASGVSQYGFASAKKIIYIKNRTAYSCDFCGRSKKLCTKARKLVTNSVGLVKKVKLAKGTKKIR